jgi:hypothetical protein
MNNEPVAWIDEETGCFVYSQYDYEDLDEHGKDGLIPLYTHPVSKAKDRFPNYESICLQCGTTIYKPFKELTDEEISQVYKEVSEPFGEKRLYEIHDFARAILLKASEK